MKNKPSYNLIFDLRGILFTYHPEFRGTEKQFAAIGKMIALLHQLHAQTNQFGKPRHRLYVLSNASLNSHHNFMTYHAAIFSYFDGIVTSAKSGYEKPDSRAYEYLLEKYNLASKTCIFIDDNPVNVSAAKALGIMSILGENPLQIKQELENYNVL